GVLTTGKHFPGHGATREDSHLCLPVVDISEKNLPQCTSLPLRKTDRGGSSGFPYDGAHSLSFDRR
ncbi:MAG: hypothetical protein KBA21_12035, partial [Mesotoga sp.]|nr:hypothetical protein [Mesotoga sp.]